jgi:hypothetical protein
MEYEAALERRRKEVEAERLQREQEQARFLEAITSQRNDASSTGALGPVSSSKLMSFLCGSKPGQAFLLSRL